MKKVISIVEDEKDLNELVKRYLEKEGYEVRAYLTYDDAVVHTVDDDVHLWILDIMLDDYYTARGWNKATGRPTKETLLRLGLDFVAEDFEGKGVFADEEA